MTPRETAEDRSRRRAAWMARVQGGDGDAYRALLDDVGPAVTSFLARRIGDAADVEDALQDTLIALHRARHTYEPSRPLEPWLFAIARNVAADYGRRRRRQEAREVPVGAALGRTPVAERPVVERTPEADGCLRDQLERALGMLPPLQRDAVAMVKLFGLTIREAATLAGTTAGALRIRAHRAYVALRAALADERRRRVGRRSAP